MVDRKQGGKTGEGASARASLYEEVTLRVIAELEAGRRPWVQPWRGAATGPGLPRNAVSKRSYSGVNILILWEAIASAAFPTQSWLTFRQALAAGGCVRKGERGIAIVYADRFVPKDADVADEARAIPFLKRFTVFNVAQCDGLPPQITDDPAPLPQSEIVPVAETLIAASGADFRVGGGEAFYSPSGDFVQVPPQSAFFRQIDYYRTALHELTHWTGHRSRLARDLAGFGTAAYAREELAAEMGSAFLCASLGIVPSVRHADYLASWLAVLRADHRAIFRAASAASKAADYLISARDAATAKAAA